MNTISMNPEEAILAVSRAALSASNVVVQALQCDDDLTITSLKDKHELLLGQVEALRSIAHIEQAFPGDPTVDPEERIIDALGHIESSMGRFIKYLVEKQHHVLEQLGVTKRTSEAYKASVIQELNKLIVAISDLRDTLLDLRWAIMDHDADAEAETFGPYSSLSELRTSGWAEEGFEDEETANLSLNWASSFREH